MKRNILKSRVFKHGALATALTIGFIVLVVVINAIAGILLDRYPLTIDLTSDNRFTLTDESVEYIKGIEKPVHIYVCRSEADFENYTGEDTANNTYAAMFKQAYEILKDYSRHSENITLEFLDLNQNPTFAEQYPEESLNNGCIIVQSDLRYKVVTVSNMFSATQYSESYVTYKSKSEQVMTSAIMYVLDEDPVTVIALNDTNDTLSDYVSLLGTNTFNIITRELLTDELDADAQVIILAGQETDLSLEELDKLDKWLDNDGQFGRTLLYIPEATVSNMPNLSEFLAEWGMEIDSGYVAETDSNKIISNNQFLPVMNLAGAEYFENESISDGYLIQPYAHPVNVLWESSQNRKTEVLIQSSDTAVLVPADITADDDFNLSEQPKQSFSVAVRGYRSKYVDNELVHSNVVVYGSRAALDSGMLSHSSMNNGSVALALVSAAVSNKNDVNILSVDFSSSVITVTSSQIRTVLIIFVIAIPVIVLALGIVTFFRRRHL